MSRRAVLKKVNAEAEALKILKRGNVDNAIVKATTDGEYSLI